MGFRRSLVRIQSPRHEPEGAKQPRVATNLENGAATADGLVLDIHLPGMSGFELYRRLAADRALPVIFITARDEPAVREEAMELGGVGSYLPKPFSGRDLLDALTRALSRS